MRSFRKTWIDQWRLLVGWKRLHALVCLPGGVRGYIRSLPVDALWVEEVVVVVAEVDEGPYDRHASTQCDRELHDPVEFSRW